MRNVRQRVWSDLIRAKGTRMMPWNQPWAEVTLGAIREHREVAEASRSPARAPYAYTTGGRRPPRKRILFGVDSLWPDFRASAWTYPVGPDALSDQRREFASVPNPKVGTWLLGRQLGTTLSAWIQARGTNMDWQNALMGAFSDEADPGRRRAQ